MNVRRDTPSGLTRAFRTLLWVANVTVLPVLVLVSFLLLTGAAHLPAALVGVALIVEMAAGALVLSWLAGSFRYPAFPYRMVVTRMGLGWLAMLPVGFFVWQFLLRGYASAQ